MGSDADPLETPAIEITGNRVGDAPMLPELPDQIPNGQPIGKVSPRSRGSRPNRCRAMDGAYDTRAWQAAIHCPAVHV